MSAPWEGGAGEVFVAGTDGEYVGAEVVGDDMLAIIVGGEVNSAKKSSTVCKGALGRLQA